MRFFSGYPTLVLHTNAKVGKAGLTGTIGEAGVNAVMHYRGAPFVTD